uniref:Ovule protein n=1 Tax=Ascaris lumbricoides TaxID=6252 RepID=A0A0M3IPH0_ASCLU
LINFQVTSRSRGLRFRIWNVSYRYLSSFIITTFLNLNLKSPYGSACIQYAQIWGHRNHSFYKAHKKTLHYENDVHETRW